MEITKREILVSVIILSIMLILGIIIHGNINESLMLEYQEYDTALQIDNDSELFVYGMKTNVGNAFVYGNLKAVDTVTYPEIDGEYSYVEKIKERYTRHTRTVMDYDEDGNVVGSHEEEYWTWDRVDNWSKHSEKISFLNVEFEYGAIDFPYSSYITTIKESSKIRYKYYGSPTECTGTIYTVLKNGTINQTNFYNNSTIDNAIESLESGFELFLFWFLWILLTIGCICVFCYLDNWWLE